MSLATLATNHTVTGAVSRTGSARLLTGGLELGLEPFLFQVGIALGFVLSFEFVVLSWLWLALYLSVAFTSEVSFLSTF